MTYNRKPSFKTRCKIKAKLNKKRAIPRQGFVTVGNNTKIRHGISKLEQDILKWFPQAKTSVLIRGFHNKIYIVDGYIEADKEIIEILGGFWHGDLRLYKPTDINPQCKKTMLQLYQETKARFQMFQQMGYKIRFIWEADWKKYKSIGRYYTGPNDNLF